MILIREIIWKAVYRRDVSIQGAPEEKQAWEGHRDVNFETLEVDT